MTTAAYVRWRRWADRKASAPRTLAVPKDVPAMFGGGPPAISDEYGVGLPNEVPAMFGDPTPAEDQNQDVPRSRRTTKRVPRAAATPSVPQRRFRATTKVAALSRTAGPTPDDAFRSALGAFIVEFGAARARAVLQQLESELLAATRG